MTPDTPTPPLCKDCRWCFTSGRLGWLIRVPDYKYAVCDNPKTTIKTIDLVSGGETIRRFTCNIQRYSQNNDDCGEHAKLFEAKL